MKKDGLSFSESVKEESAHEERDEAEKRSLLSAFLRINGYLRLSGNEASLDVASESSAMAKAIYLYLHDLYGVSARFAYTRSSGFLKRMVYHVMVENEAEDILNDLGIDYFSMENPKFLTSNAKEIAAYLTGAFWAKGSVNSPTSSSYHLELSLGDESYAKWVAKLYQRYPNHPFNAKVISRRSRYVVYLKRSDEISDFLILMGAKKQCLEFENVRVERDFENQTNRLSNLDAANYRKSLNSGERQVEEIRFFVERLGWSAFDDNEKMKTLLKLRLAHPDASLSELARMLSTALNTDISRSNVNHLFRELDAQYALAQQKLIPSKKSK